LPAQAGLLDGFLDAGDIASVGAAEIAAGFEAQAGELARMGQADEGLGQQVQAFFG
jgi:hypothetical protein